MHIDKSSGINKNHDNIELQQQISKNQQASVFGDGFPDKNNNGIVDAKDFDDDSVIKLLKDNKLLNCFWGDVYKKVNDLIHFTDNINVKTNTLYKINRKDGYDLKIVTVNNSEPVLQIQSPDKSLINIPISISNQNSAEIVDEEQRTQRLEIFKDALYYLKTNVLADFSNEINEIILTNKCAGIILSEALGEYKDNKMFIYNDFLKSQTKEELTLVITHEIGHAVDDVNNINVSNEKDYIKIFEEFQSLATQLLKEYIMPTEIQDVYILFNWVESWACLYTDLEGGNDFQTKTIEDLKDKMTSSDKPNEKRFLELYQKLKDLVQETVNERRQLPREQRCDDSIKNKIETLCNDESFHKDIEYLIENAPQLDYLDYIDNYKILLLRMTDENFNDEIKNIEKFSNNPLLDNKANENLKIISNRIIAKLMELRNDEQIKNIRQKYLK